MSAERLSDERITVDHPARMPDGIYFGLEDERYHAAFALSSHGIKWLRQSTLDFWVRSPLNPRASEVDNDTEARKIGRAYDARIVEGREVFERRFARELDKDEYPDALRTNDELITAIETAGGPVRGMKSKRKEELIATLAELGQEEVIWDTVVKRHQAEHAGKTLLPPAIVDRIEVAAKMIEAHPQLCKAFTGGEPQVSVFFTDEDTGVPCKCRFDYIKPKSIIDLKTFDNTIGLPIVKAIARAYANYRYNIQAAFYLYGASQIKNLVEGGLVFGARREDQPMIGALRENHPKTFMFCWQQKGPAPVARGWVPPRGTLDIAHMNIREALDRFAVCWQTYGTDPWIDAEDVYTADDTEIPAYIND